MPFRADEAQRIATLIGVARLERMGAHWEARACALETIVAVAAWRQQPLRARVAALIDALDATEGRAWRHWGEEDP